MSKPIENNSSSRIDYCEIYKLFDPIFKWLQDHYPHDTYFVIDSTGATMYEKRDVFAIDGYKIPPERKSYTSDEVINIVRTIFDS